MVGDLDVPMRYRNFSKFAIAIAILAPILRDQNDTIFGEPLAPLYSEFLWVGPNRSQDSSWLELPPMLSDFGFDFPALDRVEPAAAAETTVFRYGYKVLVVLAVVVHS